MCEAGGHRVTSLQQSNRLRHPLHPFTESLALSRVGLPGRQLASRAWTAQVHVVELTAKRNGMVTERHIILGRMTVVRDPYVAEPTFGVVLGCHASLSRTVGKDGREDVIAAITYCPLAHDTRAI